jgi:hypothetical protein
MAECPNLGQQVEAQLTGIETLKVNQIEAWCKERQSDAGTRMDSPFRSRVFFQATEFNNYFAVLWRLSLFISVDIEPPAESLGLRSMPTRLSIRLRLSAPKTQKQASWWRITEKWPV